MADKAKLKATVNVSLGGGARVERGETFEVEDLDYVRYLTEIGYAEHAGGAELPEGGAATEDDPLEGVAFTSDSAKSDAEEAGLSAAAFDGVDGSGKDGAYTVADVEGLTSEEDE